MGVLFGRYCPRGFCCPREDIVWGILAVGYYQGVCPGDYVMIP